MSNWNENKYDWRKTTRRKVEKIMVLCFRTWNLHIYCSLVWGGVNVHKCPHLYISLWKFQNNPKRILLWFFVHPSRNTSQNFFCKLILSVLELLATRFFWYSELLATLLFLNFRKKGPVPPVLQVQVVLVFVKKFTSTSTSLTCTCTCKKFISRTYKDNYKNKHKMNTFWDNTIFYNFYKCLKSYKKFHFKVMTIFWKTLNLVFQWFLKNGHNFKREFFQNFSSTRKMFLVKS